MTRSYWMEHPIVTAKSHQVIYKELADGTSA